MMRFSRYRGGRLNVAKKMELDEHIYSFFEGMDDYIADGVHFNAEGHRLVAEFII